MAQRDSQATEISTTGVGAALHGLVSSGLKKRLGGMSLTSLSTLATLERTGPRRVTDLAVIEGVSQPAMTAVVRSLERSGFIERREDPTDRRVSHIMITSEGTDLLRERRQAGAENFEQLIEKLPADEVKTLIAALPALIHLRSFDDDHRDPTPPASFEPPRPSRSIR